MLMLQVIRNATQADANTRAGQWTAGLGFTPKIKGMTVGIIGMCF
jgi:phosphoglycerate dehydrogenase-like enzyme